MISSYDLNPVIEQTVIGIVLNPFASGSIVAEETVLFGSYPNEIPRNQNAGWFRMIQPCVGSPALGLTCILIVSQHSFRRDQPDFRPLNGNFGNGSIQQTTQHGRVFELTI